MVKPIVTIDGAIMAQDVRPFRSSAFALLFLSAAILAAGLWAEMQAPVADPVSRLMADTIAPFVQQSLPAFVPVPQTTFGTFANIGGVIALTGLLLFTLRRAAPPAPAAAPMQPAMPRVVPRRPSALRAARTGVATATPVATVTPVAAPQPDQPDVARFTTAPAGKRTGHRLHRGALMLIGSALIGIGALFFIGRASLPVPAFTAPGSLGPDMAQPALIAAGGVLMLVAVLRIIRRRRAAA